MNLNGKKMVMCFERGAQICSYLPPFVPTKDCSISLPLFHDMTQVVQDHVIQNVRGNVV